MQISSLNILVACEFTGSVRDAFIRAGHNAVSCDLLPTETPGPHYTGDVLPLLSKPWDMVIAFPPCTHLAVSGARYFAKKRADGRQQQAIDFFMSFIFRTEHIPKVAIENPVGIMSTNHRKPDQIINPFQFGHPVSKKTCLWLKGLPLLQPTDVVEVAPPVIYGPNNKKMDRFFYDTWKLPPAERGKARSKTFAGIAEAMADQWF